MKINKTKCPTTTEILRENFAVISDALTQLSNEEQFWQTQSKLFIEETFNSNPTANRIAEIADNFPYYIELSNNTRYKTKQIVEAIQFLSDQFRYIINNQLRYQQRQDNLPPAYGYRFFRTEECHRGSHYINLCLFCDNIEVIEFIVRCWCDKFNIFPHELTALFTRDSQAKAAMPNRKIDSAHYQNCRVYKIVNGIQEEYFHSMPYRLKHYINCKGCHRVQFGSAALIAHADTVYFPDSDFTRITPFYTVAEGIFSGKGLRTIQSFGNYKTASSNTTPRHYKKRVIPSNCNDNRATQYYRACKAGKLKYNAYIHQTLKSNDVFRNCTPSLNRFILDRFMDTLVDAVAEIEELRAIIANKI